MKLHLTGYKCNAPKGAFRLDLSTEYDVLSLLKPYFYNRPPKHFKKQLADFIESSRGEHIAIYFWITHRAD